MKSQQRVPPTESLRGAGGATAPESPQRGAQLTGCACALAMPTPMPARWVLDLGAWQVGPPVTSCIGAGAFCALLRERAVAEAGAKSDSQHLHGLS